MKTRDLYHIYRAKGYAAWQALRLARYDRRNMERD